MGPGLMGALLLFVALLFTGAAADDAAHCVIETCSGCRLNRLPKVRMCPERTFFRFPSLPHFQTCFIILPAPLPPSPAPYPIFSLPPH